MTIGPPVLPNPPLPPDVPTGRYGTDFLEEETFAEAEETKLPATWSDVDDLIEYSDHEIS